MRIPLPQWWEREDPAHRVIPTGFKGVWLHISSVSLQWITDGQYLKVSFRLLHKDPPKYL
jgi:hypothetical protein